MKVLQDRGQFFVKSVCKERDIVPVDNFVFIEVTNQRAVTTEDYIKDSPNEVKLANACGQVIVSWNDKHEWLSTNGEGLRRMADILEGKVSYEAFGVSLSDVDAT